MQPQKTLPCPTVGHKRFEKNIGLITIGDADSPHQISKFIRPRCCLIDEMGLEHSPGELQKADLVKALSMFSYPSFIDLCFRKNQDLFLTSECRIYQFQTRTGSTTSGCLFKFGLFITDSADNLIDFCVESKNPEKRKTVLLALIRAICTPVSIHRKIHH